MAAAPIEPEFVEQMNELAGLIDTAFNGPATPGLPRNREAGFVLLTFKFGQMDNGRINYISNGERGDIVTAMKELIARFEGRYADPVEVRA